MSNTATSIEMRFNDASFHITSLSGRRAYIDGASYGEVQHANADDMLQKIADTGDLSLVQDQQNQREHAFDVHERGDADKLYGTDMINRLNAITDIVSKATKDKALIARVETDQSFGELRHDVENRFDEAIRQTNDAFEQTRREFGM